ncbi:MAG: hypothetical protein PVH91_14915 [Pseudomonadales bacterium]|jgi:hypothetical protein
MTGIEEELGFTLRPIPSWVKRAMIIVATAWLLQIPGFLLGLML